MTSLHPWWVTRANCWAKACAPAAITEESLSAAIGADILDFAYFSEMAFPSPDSVAVAVGVTDEVVSGSYRILVERSLLCGSHTTGFHVAPHDSPVKINPYFSDLSRSGDHS